MKAIMCKEFAPVENLSWEEVPDPIPEDNEIVVDVRAAGLNYPDNLIVRGLYQFKPELPFSPGHEGAGVVEEVGSAICKVQPGDHVVLTYNSCGICPNCQNAQAAYFDDVMALTFVGQRPDWSTPLS